MKLKSSLFLGCIFFAASITAHADTKTWNGSSSADWNTNDNWTASGVPLAADDVVFDGTGTNLNISLSAPGPLQSLKFTAGQTSAVNINTIAGSSSPVVPAANLSFGATATSLTVEAGSGNHKITGTGVSTGTTFRDVAFDSTLTSFTFDIGGTTTFEINGRVGGGSNNATYAKNGTGTLILSGPNGSSGSWQFSGTSAMFNVNQGVVRFANAAASGNSGNKYTVASGAAIELSGGFTQSFAAGTITLNGTGTGIDGVIRSLSGTNAIGGTGSGGIVLASDSSIGVDADTLTISPIISGSGKSLTKVGAGTLTLSGANTYTGTTIVSAGTLALGATNVLANSTPVTLGAATTLSIGAGFTDTLGTLDVAGAATINLGSGASALAFANSSSVDWTGGTLNITGTLGATSIRFGTTSGGLTSGQLALISVNGSGAGNYILDGSGYLTTVKTWDGSDSADWGTAANWSGDALPGSGEAVTFTSTSPSGYDIYLGTAARTTNGLIFNSTTTATPYTINLQESSTVTTRRILTVGTGGVIVNAGTHTITGFQQPGGGSAGDLQLATSTFNIAANSSLSFNARLRHSTTGQSYSKTGTGTLALNADNGGGSGWIHTGFTVSQGVLRLAAANATGNSGNTYTVSSGAAIEITGGFSQTIGSGAITLNGTGIAGAGTLRSTSGNNAISGTGTTQPFGVVLASDSSIGVDADTLTINQVVSGAFNLTKVGAGTLALSNVNTYGGTTTVSAGTLSLGNATNTLPDTTAVTLGAATLSVGTACADTVGTLDVTGAATINLGDASSALVFADSSAIDWTGGTISITGTFVPGASIKFGVGGLTGDQLTKISASGWTSFGLDTNGFLTATPTGGGNNFASWASSQTPQITGGANGDDDKDGVSNLVEYALADGQERGSLSGNTLTFTKRGAPYGGDITYIIKTSTTLEAGSWTAEVTQGPAQLGDPLSYTFTPGTPVKKFARLKVTSP